MKGLWIFVGIAVVCLFGGVMVHNKAVRLNETVDQSYSDVQAQQKRRTDLIPNLVASVKGYVKEEETVLTNIANARAAVVAASSDKASSIDANRRLDVAISPLLRLQESYPQLKGNEQFLRLEDELAGTENRIFVARRKYNADLNVYNTYVKQFPASAIAGMSGYHPREEYFKGNPEDANAPTVDFSK